MSAGCHEGEWQTCTDRKCWPEFAWFVSCGYDITMLMMHIHIAIQRYVHVYVCMVVILDVICYTVIEKIVLWLLAEQWELNYYINLWINWKTFKYKHTNKYVVENNFVYFINTLNAWWIIKTYVCMYEYMCIHIHIYTYMIFKWTH